MILTFTTLGQNKKIYLNATSHVREYAFIFPSNEIYEGLSAFI